MRRLLTSFIVLAALVVAADFGARFYAQSVVAKELRSAFQLSENPDVSLNGFPFLRHVISGDLPSASIEADRLEADGIRLEGVRMTLRDLRFSSGRLVSQGNGTIRARRGEGTARLTEAGVNEALARRGLPVGVSFEAGRALIAGPTGDVEVDLALQGGSVGLRGPGVSSVIPLPTILNGLQYTSVRVGTGEAVLDFRLQNAVVRVGD